MKLDPPRTWTDTTGRTLEGILISKEESSALIRVLGNQRVYRIPFERLSNGDRTYLSNWTPRSSEESFYPAVSSQWPVVLGGASVAPRLEPLPDGNGWRSPNYDFVSESPLDRSTVEDIAKNCEMFHHIAVQTPLPLRWGRPHEERRQIRLYQSDAEFSRSGTQANWGAFYSIKDNKVHLPLASLEGSPSIPGSRIRPTKRKSYEILLHELTHQESVGLLVLDCPTWCAEGVAELFSAMQRTPGVFVFNNPQITVRNHLHDSFHLTEVGKLVGMPLPKLDSFLDIDLRSFNKKTANAQHGGTLYYNASLLLVDYFCFADGNSLRPYMEAILTGVSPEEAKQKHLLRGRTVNALESAIAERWDSQGLKIRFEEKPILRDSDLLGRNGWELWVE